MLPSTRWNHRDEESEEKHAGRRLAVVMAESLTGGFVVCVDPVGPGHPGSVSRSAQDHLMSQSRGDAPGSWCLESLTCCKQTVGGSHRLSHAV